MATPRPAPHPLIPALLAVALTAVVAAAGVLHADVDAENRLLVTVIAAVGIAGGQVSAIEPAAGPAAAAETGSPRSQVSAARPAGRLLAREGAAA